MVSGEKRLRGELYERAPDGRRLEGIADEAIELVS